MFTINPYLNFPGQTEEAFNFYKSVFGGEFMNLTRFRDTAEADKIPEKERDRIMHVSLPVGKGNMLMATDGLEANGPHIPGNNFYLTIETDTRAEAEKLFNGLSSGGTVTMPMADTFWGAYFGMLQDKFGIQWMVSYTAKQGS